MMKVTYFGTTVLLFDDGKHQILFDAHFTRPSMKQYLFHQCKTDEVIVEDILKHYALNRLEAIFISHSHHDHVMDVASVALKTGAKIYGSNSTKNVALGGGVKEDCIVVFNGRCHFKVEDYEIEVIPSIHSKPTVFNNDLGQEIQTPLSQPTKLRKYKEGGSYDFLVTHHDKKYLIRPSFNYIEGQLEGIKADVLFLGVAGITKVDESFKQRFFEETIEKVKPKCVIPLHWDNFFSSLTLPKLTTPLIENTDRLMYEFVKGCNQYQCSSMVLLPFSSFEFE